MTGRTMSVDPRYRTFTLREPLGVCGFIVSFNYPLRKLFSLTSKYWRHGRSRRH